MNMLSFIIMGKIEKTCIFLFSGTGMTRYVIEKVRHELAALQGAADVFDIEDTDPAGAAYDNYDAIGIAYPVHSFNAPKIVIDFARKLPAADKKSAFIISSAGAGHYLNFASSRLLISVLRKKGFEVFYDRQFVMPSNFLIKDGDAKVKSNIRDAAEKAVQAAREISEGLPYRQKDGLIARLICFIGRIEWAGTKYIGRRFYADDTCDRCGVCAGRCPSRNISVEQDRVSFKSKCGLCMRCFYVCPNNSIKIRRPFNSFRFDSWYDDGDLSGR